MALKVKFEAETGNDVATAVSIAQSIASMKEITSETVLDIAAHLNIIGRTMKRSELAAQATENEVVEEETTPKGPKA